MRRSRPHPWWFVFSALAAGSALVEGAWLIAVVSTLVAVWLVVR